MPFPPPALPEPPNSSVPAPTLMKFWLALVSVPFRISVVVASTDTARFAPECVTAPACDTVPPPVTRRAPVLSFRNPVPLSVSGSAAAVTVPARA
jgi:hypothetical protein